MNPEGDYRERWCDEKNVNSRGKTKRFSLRKLEYYASTTPMTTKTMIKTTDMNLADSNRLVALA